MSDIKPEDYSCEILLEKTTPEKAKDSSFPTDAYNVTYTVDGEDRLDVCRAQKAANIFDLYYDKYKNVKSIQYGSGTCLLYTSPSPRDGLLSRMPSSA